jgi:arylsulfatase A-like enzyme/Tfp pilus assembly protein PilF
VSPLVIRRPHLLASCVSLLLLLGVPAHVSAAPQRASAAPKRLNVILITMDTLRADHVACYGAKTVQTPTLDSLAKDGVVFSQVPLTWPSHAAILTGTYPFQNGVQDFTGHPLSPEFRSIAQAFKHAGYATGAVVSSFVLDRSWGLARGFDYYDDAFSATAFQQKDIGLVDRRADESVNHALAWLKKNQQHPFFFWLHLYDPHSPYDPPEPFRSEYRDHPYDGEIAYADRELGRLIAWLKANWLYDHSLIAFLSDHGESLGEHAEKEHGFFIYNSTTHIPLIVKPAAGSRRIGDRVDAPAETIAVAPTLVTMAGVKDSIEKQFQSKGLFDFSLNENDAAYSETFYPFSSFGWSPLHSLENAKYHYIEAPQPELYDVIADPREQKNLVAQQTAIVEVLRGKLHDRLKLRPFDQSQPSSGSVNSDAAEKLRALGYVAYQSPVSAEALAKGLPDPKSKLWEFNAILQATDAFHVNDFQTGESLLTKVREQDPQMYLIPFMLGEAASRRHDWPVAATEFRKCLDANPNFDQAMMGLAHTLINNDDFAGARPWAEKALKINGENYRAWYLLGAIDSRTDKKAALTDYEKAVSIQGNFPPLRRDLGILLAEQQSYPQAVVQLEKAVGLGLEDAQLYNFLGIAYSKTNRAVKAIESYRKAIKLDSTLAEAHLNLGFAYQKQNRHQAALEEYKAACTLREKYCGMVPSDSR